MNLDSLFCSPVPNATIITESLNHSLEMVRGNFSCVIMFQVCCCILVMKFTNGNNTTQKKGCVIWAKFSVLNLHKMC